ncbi:MAG: aldose epimerase family protein [Clostridia bacterium]|nr:aldose epimerase family protein [Clostridia bacterium]
MSNIIKKHFGYMDDGRVVSTYSLKNANGMKVKITDFGGAIMQIKTPDKEGRMTDVVCGFSSLEDYKHASGYHGALVGRVGNRICKGKFTLDGKEYSLYINNKENSLHGGKEGFSFKLWDAAPIDGEEPQLVLEYTSPDMEEGYPGTLSVKVTYTLTSDNALSIHYEATTDKKTIVNLTNHVYFNLGGFASGSIEGHRLWIDSDSYVPTDASLIPTGEIKKSEGTPFDFKTEKEIGRDIDADDPDIINGGGYDITFNFVGGETSEPVHRATLYDPESGRELFLITNQPGVQVYTGNFMNGPHRFKGGYPQRPRHGVALETQKMPDAINHPNFTSVVLDKGEKYDYTTTFKFGVRK